MGGSVVFGALVDFAGSRQYFGVAKNVYSLATAYDDYSRVSDSPGALNFALRVRRC